MKIAFFSPKPFSKKLGATKNRIELAESLEVLGWETVLIDKDEVMLSSEGGKEFSYNEALKNYLIKNAHKYDVVLYEYDSLPFSRDLFCEKTLFVARPALISYPDTEPKIPLNFRARLSMTYNKLLNSLSFTKASSRSKFENEKAISLSQCDVIQVQNSLDAKLLKSKGFNEKKIIVVPNGISDERRLAFQKEPKNYKEPFTIAFIGTFDFRKGAMDFPFIVKAIIKKHPDCRFKLLGTQGLFTTAAQVLNFFPRKLRHAIKVVPTFEPMELPELLKNCQIGIFPSYLESFGFGALEMMCAGLPVVSYYVPGPSDFILRELFVSVGDKKLLANKVMDLMEDRVKLARLAQEAREEANRFSWSKIAVHTSKIYEHHCKRLNPTTTV